MQRKLRAWAICLMALLLFSGCASGTQEATNQAAAPKMEEESYSWENGNFQMDGAVIQLPVLYETIGKQGWNFADETDGDCLVEANSCQTESVDLINATYPEIIMRAAFCNEDASPKKRSSCRIYSIAVSNATYDRVYAAFPTVNIEGGIHFGSTQDEMVAAYGTPQETTQGSFDTSYFFSKGTAALEFGIQEEFGITRIQIAYLPIGGRNVE